MSPADTHDEHRLTNRIYAAALDASLWPGVLEGIIGLCGARTGCILNFDMLDPSQNFFIPHGLPASAIEEYRAKGYDQLEFEVHREIMAPYVPGLAVAAYRKAGSQEKYRQRLGGLYTEIYAPNGVEYLIGATLDAGDYKWSVISLHRTLAQGEFPAGAMECLTRLATHVARSLQIKRRLAAVERATAPLYELLELLDIGVVLLDGNGRVTRANQLAGAIMRTHGGLAPDTQSGLRAVDPGAQAVLSALVRDAIDGTGEFGGVLAAPNQGAPHPLKVTVVPLAGSGLHPELGRDGIRVAVFVTDPARPRLLSETTMARLYQLTAAECAVAGMLLNGHSINEVAAARNVSVETVRDQVGSIYAKTRTTGLVDLVRLLSALAGEFAHVPLPEPALQ